MRTGARMMDGVGVEKRGEMGGCGDVTYVLLDEMMFYVLFMYFSLINYASEDNEKGLPRQYSSSAVFPLHEHMDYRDGITLQYL